MGLVSGLGFPYFARFVPEGRSGSYSGLYFAVRGIASAIALPAAGGLIAVTGSYRVLMVMAGVGLLALVPLGRAEAARRGALRRAPRPVPQRLGAVIPCIDAGRLDTVLRGTLRHVAVVAIVDDGAPPEAAAAIDRAGEQPDVLVVRLPDNAGKGEAVAAGAARLLALEPAPDAIVVIDADGQHPPAAIPAFARAAADADVVIGDRRADREAMPRVRRATNAISSALLSLVLRRRMLDSQCGMRLYRADALATAPLPDGRYEAETVHLKRAVRGGLEVGWVPIPAIYDGAPSAFRPVRDTARVLGAILGVPSAHRPSMGFTRLWTARQAAIVAGTLLLGALTPLLGGLDHRLFTAVNRLGAGPDWFYEALDPHTRNYILLCLAATLGALLLRRRVSGTVLAVTLAAFWSNLLVQTVYLLYDRPRPEETLPDGDVLLVAERSWGHIASFPSGHLVVTTAIAVAAMSAVPALRGALWTYVGLIALTRITFGAHFPLDVFAGLVFGAVVGRFCAAFAHEVGLLARPAALMPALPPPLLRRLRPTGAAPGP
jgi:membrane-associated phospholipid phosphatase